MRTAEEICIQQTAPQWLVCVSTSKTENNWCYSSCKEVHSQKMLPHSSKTQQDWIFGVILAAQKCSWMLYSPCTCGTKGCKHIASLCRDIAWRFCFLYKHSWFYYKNLLLTCLLFEFCLGGLACFTDHLYWKAFVYRRLSWCIMNYGPSFPLAWYDFQFYPENILLFRRRNAKYIQKMTKYSLHIKLDSDFNFRKKKKPKKLQQKYSSPCGNDHVNGAVQFWA